MNEREEHSLSTLRHWIWSWHVQLARLRESTRHDGKGANQELRQRAFSVTSLDKHLLLVVGHQAVLALKNAEPSLQHHNLGVTQNVSLRLLRNLHEHWDEQQPAFRMNGPDKTHSGKDFEDAYPRQNPWSISYSSNDWLIGGVLSVSQLTVDLDAIEEVVSDLLSER